MQPSAARSWSQCQRLVVHPPSVTSGGHAALPSCDVSDNARAALPFQCHAQPPNGPFVEGFHQLAFAWISVQSDAPKPPTPPAAALALLLQRHRTKDLQRLCFERQDALIMAICESSFAGNIRNSFFYFLPLLPVQNCLKKRVSRWLTQWFSFTALSKSLIFTSRFSQITRAVALVLCTSEYNSLSDKGPQWDD